MPCPKLKNHLASPFPPSLEILLFWVHVLIIVSSVGLADLWTQQLTQLLNMLLHLRQASCVINMIYLPLSWKLVGKIGLPFVVLPSLMNWLVKKKKKEKKKKKCRSSQRRRKENTQTMVEKMTSGLHYFVRAVL